MITYRKPKPDEAEAFAALHVQCWREAYTPILPLELVATFSSDMRLGMWQAATADSERFVMGAFSEAVPVGFIISGATKEKYIDAQDGHLWGLYICASEQNQGIGRKLVEMAHGHWVSQGGHSMTVGVLAANVPALRFYERLGETLFKHGTYDWNGFALPDCTYIWQNLAKLAKF